MPESAAFFATRPRDDYRFSSLVLGIVQERAVSDADEAGAGALSAARSRQ